MVRWMGCARLICRADGLLGTTTVVKNRLGVMMIGRHPLCVFCDLFHRTSHENRHKAQRNKHPAAYARTRSCGLVSACSYQEKRGVESSTAQKGRSIDWQHLSERKGKGSCSFPIGYFLKRRIPIGRRGLRCLSWRLCVVFASVTEMLWRSCWVLHFGCP